MLYTLWVSGLHDRDRTKQISQRALASCNLNQPLAGDKRISLRTSNAKTQSKLQRNSTLLKQQRLAERPAGGGLRPERRGQAIQTQRPQPPVTEMDVDKFENDGVASVSSEEKGEIGDKTSGYAAACKKI